MVAARERRRATRGGTHAPNQKETKNKHHEDLHTPHAKNCRAANSGPFAPRRRPPRVRRGTAPAGTSGARGGAPGPGQKQFTRKRRRKRPGAFTGACPVGACAFTGLVQPAVALRLRARLPPRPAHDPTRAPLKATLGVRRHHPRHDHLNKLNVICRRATGMLTPAMHFVPPSHVATQNRWPVISTHLSGTTETMNLNVVFW